MSAVTPSAPAWSVVVPTRRAAKLREEFLPGLLEAAGPSAEVVLALDNVPAPAGAADARVRWVQHCGTRGFAPACNTGARAAHGIRLLFLNDDILVGHGLLEALSPVLDSGAAAAVGPDVWSVALGRSESGTRLYWHHGVLESRQEALAGEGLVEVPYVCGAALAVRAADFGVVGGFDERLAPYYWEDVDLCLRLRSRFAPAAVLADVRVEHAHGATISQEPAGRRRRIYERNRLLVSWGALEGARWLRHLAWITPRLAAALLRDPRTALALPGALLRRAQGRHEGRPPQGRRHG